jgi:N-methylhydantoinase B/oxoprolinase/acetone carboxylase alpha subunit
VSSVGGGCGASLGRDGIGRNCFPSSARNVPVEVLELRTPVMVWNRSLRPGSAGGGQWRGAFGHQIEFTALPQHPGPVAFFLNPDWLRFSPAGLAGGEPGPRTALFVNGNQLSTEDIGAGQIVLPTPADRLEWHVPGGGGYGPPERRDPALIDEDARAGLTSAERAPVAAPGG